MRGLTECPSGPMRANYPPVEAEGVPAFATRVLATWVAITLRLALLSQPLTLFPERRASSGGAHASCLGFMALSHRVPAVAALPPIIGTAGWSVPRAVADQFDASGSALRRYASRCRGVEINSSFYRSHRPSTYERWAESVPEHFRFSVKIPKIITHELALAGARAPLDQFLGEAMQLGQKLGCLLVQLPPKQELDRRVAQRFFALLRRRYDGPVAIEPRNATWFTTDAARLMLDHRIARVAADPARVPEAAEPGGWDGFIYYRLHGSPRMYYSSYEPEYLAALAARISSAAARVPVWCIFDNTTLGAASANALDLVEMQSRLVQ